MSEFTQPNMSSLKLTSHCDLMADFSPITSAEVTRALCKCNPNTAYGHDQIGYQVIVKLHSYLPNILPDLITALFKYGVHHPEWKKAICVVVPKPEKSSYNTASAYRPIPLLSCLRKLVERIASI